MSARRSGAERMTAVFPSLRPDGYRPHALHSSERIWPETNCYVDLWIEVLNAMRLPPEAMLGFTLTQDFEGDQFTFFKVPLEDLESLYGIRVTELAIFDRVEDLGGAVAAIEAGYMQSEIEEAAYQEARLQASGESVVVGVNRFEGDGADPIEVLRVDPALERGQVERLGQWRRDREPADDHLAALAEHGPCAEHRHSFAPIAQSAPTLFEQAGAYAA